MEINFKDATKEELLNILHGESPESIADEIITLRSNMLNNWSTQYCEKSKLLTELKAQVDKYNALNEKIVQSLIALTDKIK